MAFAPGARLGPYEVVSLLGSGGMGEVYKARDTRLDRTVAIKILPAALGADPQFRDRFDREARTISQLDHPHICALFDVGAHAGTSYLVMPYLEGATLADRLVKGPLPVAESLTIAIQIAEALYTAHRAGIVHRDLKPANIMLTKGGVKLLDFGLAKTTGPAMAGAGLSRLPTTPPTLTAHGTILGTFQYMAPEQLEGHEADARTDIFAFGAVVYEMVTGRKAFEEKSQASLISAIMSSEPPPMASLQPLTPPALDHVVTQCLAKDPDERWQSAGDVMRELNWVADTGHLATSTVPTPVAPVTARRQERVAWALFGIAALVIVALLIPAARYLREQPVDAPEVRFEIPTPYTTQPLHFALSPDGTRLVFVASGNGVPRLWLRALDALAAQPLAGSEGAEYPFWSPDGRSIGFFAGAKLKRLEIAGGVPQILADAPNGRGGTWNQNGTIVFAPTNASPLWRVQASGGEAVPVTTLNPSQGSHRLPQFLPDDRHFLFFVQGNPDTQGIFVGSLDGSAAKRLTPADVAGAYAEPGVLVFMQQGGLIARRVNAATGTLEGDAVTVVDGVGSDVTLNLRGFSVAKARLAYRTSGLERRQLTWFDRTGKRLGTVGELDPTGLLGPELSPDGRRVAVYGTGQSNKDVWLIDLIRGGQTRLTFDASAGSQAVWSPDGGQVAFASNRRGQYDLYLKPWAGGGSDQSLLESSNVKLPTDWSRDGRFLLYQYGDPKTGWDLAALPMTGTDRKPMVVANTPFEERGGQFSPDTRWVAYQSNASGRFEIYVQPFPGPGPQWPVSTAGGTDPRWRADGKELFFIGLDGTLMAVPVGVSGPTFEAGSPTALFHTRMAMGGNANLKQQYAVSRDGRFLVNMPVETSTAPITLILNWHLRLTP